MAVASGPCPNCGSTIEFRAGASASLVCRYCKHVVVRTDRDFRNLGRVADVVFSDTGLAPGDRGTFRGRSFSVEGRLVLAHPQGGQWEEYYVLFDGREPAWISEAQGFWHVVAAVRAPAPPPHTVRPQMPVQIGPTTFVVQEQNDGTFLSAEGELPFAAMPGTTRRFVDLSAPGGAWATIDYNDGRAPAQVFVGVKTTFAELVVQQRGGERPAHAVQTATIRCPSCGAPLPVLMPGTERATCRHCRALSDVKLQQLVAHQNRAREEPGIALGRRGVLPVVDALGVANAEWTVLGYVERSSGRPGTDDWFGWQEYLLYNPQHGYRWLVYDEGRFNLITPLSAGDVDATQAPRLVRFRDRPFRLRNQNEARVDYVLGEFYWKIAIGERVFAQDYEQGIELVSCERSSTEVNWSHGVFIPPAIVTNAFGWVRKVSVYGAGDGTTVAQARLLFVLGSVFLILFLMALDGCGSGSSTGSGGIRFGSGGFGGK